MRLDKFLSNMGKGTRTEIKKGISKGLAVVDGQTIKKVNHQVNPEKQAIEYNGEMVSYSKYIYLVMNKPKDVISATEDNRHKTVIDLVKETYGNRKLFPVGRLDIDTEGMLFITDDGQWNYDLMSPKKHVTKTYYARINDVVDDEDIEAFKAGIVLSDGTLCRSAELKIIGASEIELIISEGKYHQVKRMFEARGKKVLYLKRIAIGGLSLDSNLELGEYRELTDHEMKKIKLED